MKGRIDLRINWGHLSAVLFCLAAWAIIAVAGARVSDSYRVHRFFDQMTRAVVQISPVVEG